MKLLVERIVVGRDENGNTSVRITHRFGPPEPSGEEDEFVSGVELASPSHPVKGHQSGVYHDVESPYYDVTHREPGGVFHCRRGGRGLSPLCEVER